MDGADQYTFNLYAGNRAGGTAAHSVSNLTGNRLELPLDRYQGGSYTWTVQALTNGTAGGSRVSSPVASAAFDLQIQQIRPISLDYPPSGTEYPGLQAQQQPDRIRWSSSLPAVNTRFILSRNANPLQGTPLMNIPNPPATIPLIALSEGTYYWTIQGETEDGLSINSAISSFRVLAIPPVAPVPPLPAAQERLPANGYAMGPEQLRASPAITFSWAAVPGANRYILAIYRETGGNRQLVRQWESSAQTSRVLDDLSILGSGSFIWQVEAVSQAANGTITQRGTVGENRFTIDLPALPRDTPRDPGKVYGQ
ncbi:hypothetical protein FACS1894142_5590 [Spirochaetia bacterium]|nr:hypothetical protein FACS1894142_5590 [Spirochaetia bacterium]